MFERTSPYAYLGTFHVSDGDLDGVQETDGIDCIHASMPGYPNGFFIAQDGLNMENGQRVAQNFKVVSWDKVQAAIDSWLSEA